MKFIRKLLLAMLNIELVSKKLHKMINLKISSKSLKYHGLGPTKPENKCHLLYIHVHVCDETLVATDTICGLPWSC